MLKGVGLGLLISAGLGSIGWAQDSVKFDGQYMGELTLTKEISGDCTRPPTGALYGKINEHGMFEASARLRKGVVHMTGLIQGNQVSALIESPSCNYTFRTKN
jgi:hypothetical protein